MNRLHLASLLLGAGLLSVAACGDSPTQKPVAPPDAEASQPVIHAGGPMNDHVPGEALSVHSVGVSTNANPTNNVRVIWHAKAGVTDYHIQVCPDADCTSSLFNDPDEAGTALVGMAGHLYKDVTITVPVTQTTYYARVKANGTNCPGGTQNSPTCFNRYDVATFTLGTANQTPTAEIESPATVAEGSSATFDASGSSDPDAGDAIVSYAWDLDDDNTVDGTGVTFSPTFAQDGQRVVRLTVSDGDETTSVTAQITVLNVLPAVTVNSIAPTLEGGSITGGGSFTDPGADSWTATVDYGDGSGTSGLALTGKTFTLGHTYANSGSFTVTVTVFDDDGSSSGTSFVTVNNVAPSATFNAPSSVAEGSAIALSLTSPNDVSPADVAAGFTYAFDCGSGYGTAGSDNTASCPTSDEGTPTVKGKVIDQDGGFSEYTATVSVTNVAPELTLGGNGTANEGSAFTRNGSFTDPGTDSWTATVDYGDGTGTNSLSLSGKTFSLGHTYSDNGVFTVTVTVADGDGGTDTETFQVTVANVAPTVSAISGLPSGPVPAGTVLNVSVTFSDAGTADTHTGQIVWDVDNASTTTATMLVSETNGAGTASASRAMTAGVYTIRATITDDDGGATTVEAPTYVVVYDPTAGFVTGGGWVNYAATSCTVCGGRAGRGDFGFVSKYQKGATKPSGNTRFEFDMGTLAFVSTDYEWLVVAGSRAQFKGTGTINGIGNYGFLLTALDGATDAFRVKIWNKSTGDVVFDNQMNAAEDSNASTLLNKVDGNGSIIIHAK